MSYRRRGMGEDVLWTAALAPTQFAFYKRGKTTEAEIYSTQYKVGEGWRGSVWNGPANVPVTVSAVQDGVNLGSRVVGYTDGRGSFDLDGTMGTGEIGAWLQVWSTPAGKTEYGQDQPANSKTIQFTVAADVVPAVTPPAAKQPAASTPPPQAPTRTEIPKWAIPVAVLALILIAGSK